MTWSKNRSGSASTSGSARRSPATVDGELGHLGAAGGRQVGRDVGVEGEQRGGGADLGPHVADRGLAGGADGVGAGPEVLDDGPGAARHREQFGDLEDHVLGRRPAATAIRVRCTPMSLGQRTLNGWPVMTSMASPPPDPDGHHAQPAGVGRVAVGADHHPAGEGVVLEDDLVDDPRARLPEPDAEPGADGPQEVVDLGVGVQGRRGGRRPSATLAWMRWSQWTVVGTGTSSRPAAMSWSATIWARASCRATRSGSKSA